MSDRDLIRWTPVDSGLAFNRTVCAFWIGIYAVLVIGRILT